LSAPATRPRPTPLAARARTFDALERAVPSRCRPLEARLRAPSPCRVRADLAAFGLNRRRALRNSWVSSIHPLQPEPTMNATLQSAQTSARYELRFSSLFDEGRGLSFPCDAQGQVDIDALSSRARLNYLYARTVIGREFSMPAVRRNETLH
jgi:hypothetical protein